MLILTEEVFSQNFCCVVSFSSCKIFWNNSTNQWGGLHQKLAISSIIDAKTTKASRGGAAQGWHPIPPTSASANMLTHIWLWPLVTKTQSSFHKRTAKNCFDKALSGEIWTIALAIIGDFIVFEKLNKVLYPYLNPKLKW